MSRRYLPNIIITGTPGCGKSSHSQNLVSHIKESIGKDLKHFNISDIAKDQKFIESYDAKLDTSIVDEDKLLDYLEVALEKGGIIIDWHCCEIFPERLIDLVVVLKVDNSILYDRLKKRNYNDLKLQENLDCEIMEIILNEARDSYIPEIVIELNSNDIDELENNVERIALWIENWLNDHKNGVTNELQPAESESELEREGEEEEEEREQDEEESNEEMEHLEDLE
ncbi:unnamed protein product [Candida verbasci]|uniref:Adenylate kinase isoenzyme 6 homolog n=1 Tax=Candida verbasci TaxID=1227364 RepID=A0A9W4TWA4_9ASCO|nr:unnamed protein product [Candida verbasci]